MNKRILIVDDHTIFCEGLKALLCNKKSYEIVGVINDPIDLIEEVSQMIPNIIIMDISLPRANGLVLTQKIRSKFKNIKVIVLSMHTQASLIREAIKNGAATIIAKDGIFEELIEAIDHLEENDTYLSSDMKNIQLEEGDSGKGSRVLGELSGREIQVMSMLAQGWPNAIIAEHLCLSIKTVESHRRNLMKKMKLQSLVDLTRMAIREGLIKA